jgi:aryl sulfotransferase
MDKLVDWPIKTRDLKNHHFDSTVWDDFVFRGDDIVIATYAKSGTTWLQQIVSQLLFDGASGLEVARMSPCVEHRVPPRDVKLPLLEAQSHRRFLKTHMPLDALVFSPEAKYVHVARDGRDVVMSLYNHHTKANDVWYRTINETSGLVGEPMPRPAANIQQYFDDWLDRDGYPFWPFWAHARSWWRAKQLPNVLMLHYANLKRDLPGEIRRVAEFLKIPIRAASWPSIVEHSTFEYMRENATQSLPFEGKFWDEGAKAFINKGVNGRWREQLLAAQIARYEREAERQLGAECARWFATGDRSLLDACPGGREAEALDGAKADWEIVNASS